MKSNYHVCIIAIATLAAGLVLAQPAAAQPTNSPTGVLPDKPKVKAQEPAAFQFSGGVPIDFIAAVERQFDVDWLGIVSIPKQLQPVSVPKLRLSRVSAEDILKVYNRLGDQDASLGKWHWEGPVEKPDYLVPMPASAPTANYTPPDPVEFKVFMFKYITGESLAAFAQAVSSAEEGALDAQHARGKTPIPGKLVIDQRTSSVLASGPPDYLAMVEKLARTLDIPDYIAPVKVPSGQTNGASGKSAH